MKIMDLTSTAVPDNKMNQTNNVRRCQNKNHLENSGNYQPNHITSDLLKISSNHNVTNHGR